MELGNKLQDQTHCISFKESSIISGIQVKLQLKMVCREDKVFQFKILDLFNLKNPNKIIMMNFACQFEFPQILFVQSSR